MEIIREGKENRVICTNCCTEYEFNVDDIFTYGEAYYVKCPVCGKKHKVERTTSQRLGGSLDYHENEVVKEILHEYYLKHKEEIDRRNHSGDNRGLIMYMNGEERY